MSTIVEQALTLAPTSSVPRNVAYNIFFGCVRQPFSHATHFLDEVEEGMAVVHAYELTCDGVSAFLGFCAVSSVLKNQLLDTAIAESVAMVDLIISNYSVLVKKSIVRHGERLKRRYGRHNYF